MFKYIFSFILLFTSSPPCHKDQFAISYFCTSLIVLIQVYNWEIRHHWFVAVGLLTFLYILKQSYPGKESLTSSFQQARESSSAGKPETETEENRSRTSLQRDQRVEGIVENANQPAQGVEFYIPHKSVIREETS